VNITKRDIRINGAKSCLNHKAALIRFGNNSVGGVFIIEGNGLLGPVIGLIAAAFVRQNSVTIAAQGGDNNASLIGILATTDRRIKGNNYAIELRDLIPRYPQFFNHAHYLRNCRRRKRYCGRRRVRDFGDFAGLESPDIRAIEETFDMAEWCDRKLIQLGGTGTAARPAIHTCLV
jgi:hypothetical protein